MNKLERLQAVCLKAREVREAQKTYFRTRDRDDLGRSKKAEAELDKMIPDALREDDLLEMRPPPKPDPAAGEYTVGALPHSPDPDKIEVVVCDALPSVAGAIAIGHGTQRAKVRFDGNGYWRIVSFLGT